MMSPFFDFSWPLSVYPYRWPLELHSGTHICLLLIRRLIFYVLARIIPSCLPSVLERKVLKTPYPHRDPPSETYPLALSLSHNTPKKSHKESRVDNGAHSGGL